jgi:hypothetical protein
MTILKYLEERLRVCLYSVVLLGTQVDFDLALNNRHGRNTLAYSYNLIILSVKRLFVEAPCRKNAAKIFYKNVFLLNFAKVI